MDEDWAIDVKKYVPGADDDIITGIVRYCGIALRSRDASMVSFSDQAETDRVKANFLRKKLALTDPDDVLDAAIARVGQRMQADRTKNRVTVYYLLAEAFGRLEDFRPKTKAKGASLATSAFDAAPTQLPLMTAAPDPETVPEIEPAPVPEIEPLPDPLPEKPPEPVPLPEVVPPPAPAVPPAPPAPPAPVLVAVPAPVPLRQQAPAARPPAGQARPLLLMLGAGALVFGAIAAFIVSGRDRLQAAPAAAAAPVVVAAGPSGPATPVPAPAGAGLVSEERDGQPVLIVYFDVGKAVVAPGFADQAAGIKAWAASHPGSKYIISGYNDPTGNAALNAELSKNRAQAVQAALVATGVAEADTVLERPAATTDTQVTAAQARRVEIVVR